MGVKAAILLLKGKGYDVNWVEKERAVGRTGP